MASDTLPKNGDWPEAVPLDEQRIWIDGCFDFSHHGHAGAMLQARQLGSFLVVGVHSDEAILENKGPTVMNLQERVLAINACRWTSLAVPDAPYVTSLPWITHYGCRYVVHGDDITSDSNGEDCYRFVKDAGRFKVVRRTPDISTTDLVSRILSSSKDHFIYSLKDLLTGRGSEAQTMMRRLQDYATDETGCSVGSGVWLCDDLGKSLPFVRGLDPRKDQRVIYVDGDFDLFSPSHIEFLRQVTVIEEEHHGGKPFVVVGIYSDQDTNGWRGANYPVMSLYERSLCILQCRFVQAVVLSAPLVPTKEYLSVLPFGPPAAVYRRSGSQPDPESYTAARNMGILSQIGHYQFQDVTAEEIVRRIVGSRALYEERQRKKGAKTVGEAMERERQERKSNI